MSDEPDEEVRPPRRRSRRRRILTWVGIGALVLVVLLSTSVVVLYQHLEGNITGIPIPNSADRPSRPKVKGKQQPLNVLIIGDDDRTGTHIGGTSPGLSDTTILLHLSADRKRAYGISIPRDTMVDRPRCRSRDGKKVLPGGLLQFNHAFADGGPLCTLATVQHITDIAIDHFVVVDFAGFKDMVNAVHGVTVCVPTDVDDEVGHIHLREGTYKVNGNQALDYVRVRHGLGAPTGDLGRMKRQQAFISAMISKVYSAGTLTNPVRLVKFLNAATSSLTTDSGFAHLRELASLGSSLKSIGLDRIEFVTVPNQPWPENPNRLVFSSDAKQLWHRVKYDEPLGKFAAGAVSPGSHQPSKQPGGSNSAGTNPSENQQAARATREEAAREAGLCA
jgi:LCP family protein required for cell wall assembly